MSRPAPAPLTFDVHFSQWKDSNCDLLKTITEPFAKLLEAFGRAVLLGFSFLSEPRLLQFRLES